VAKKPRTPTPPRTPPRPVQAPKRRDTPRSGPSFSFDRRWVIGGAIAVVAIVAIVLGIVLTGGSSSPSKSTSGGYTDKVNFAALPNLHQGPPPWDNGSAFLDSRLPFLHLTALGQEQLAFHIHQHLDLYVNGKKVALPAGVGFTSDGRVTELHTHDATGLIHVESPQDRPYSLGQLFGEWGVWLSANRIGDSHGKVQWWVNGKKQTGNPALLALVPHQEIVLALGPPPLVVPKSYQFAAGT
jgi:hypothetical protein